MTMRSARWLLLVSNILLQTTGSFVIPSPNDRISSFMRLRKNDDTIQTSSKTSLRAILLSSSSSINQRQERLDLLDESLLGRRGKTQKENDTNAPSELLNKFTEIRNEFPPEQTQGQEADYAVQQAINDLLIDSSSDLPFWSSLPLMSRISKRARRRSLKRVLDLSMPTIEEEQEEDKGGTDEDLEERLESRRLRRRRRTLISILRTMSETSSETTTLTTTAKRRNPPAIVTLEKSAKMEARQRRFSDIEKRLPSGLETPKYDIMKRDNAQGYEIRNYEPYSLASVSMSTLKKRQLKSSDDVDAQMEEPKMKGASAFGALAGYIFGKNQESMKMKMTTPVFTSSTSTETPDNDDDDTKDKTMSFVLPSTYWNSESLDDEAPKPLEGSGVILERKMGGLRGVVMFGGFASDKDVEKYSDLLLKGLEKDEEWMVDDEEDNGGVVVAQYNDPFTPPWKRRNEVSIKVKRRDV